MIVLHESERTFNHCVLKVCGAIKGGDPACEVLLDAKMSCFPADKLVRTDQSCRDTPDSAFLRPFGTEKMNFNAA